MQLSKTPLIRAYNKDCMEFMQDLEENAYGLAIVDPPYGKNIDNAKHGNFVMSKHDSKNWDSEVPDTVYFEELFRVSKNQIIWGGNYFALPETECMVVWDKVNPMSGKFSDAELAWTSFGGPIRIYKQPWIGFGRHFQEKQPSIHPTQKPIALYRWLLQNYAGEGNTILDTHGGSFSLAIACWEEGYGLDIVELDSKYYNSAVERFYNYISQTNLFRPCINA